MLTDALATSTVLAFHQGGGGGGDIGMLIIVLGGIATPVWLLFSTLAWRTTVSVALGVWAVALTMAFVV